MSDQYLAWLLPKRENHITNIFNVTKILTLKAQMNVSNLAKLRTCLPRKYFHSKETAVKQFVERSLETFQIKVVCGFISPEEGLITPLQSTSWMNEWMWIYIPHISPIVSWRFTILLSEIGRQLVKAPLAAAISPYLISLTHPTHAWNKR